MIIQKNRRVCTSSQNLIRFAIRCHRENIWVLQLNIADSKKNIIVYYALRGRNWTFHVKCDVSSMSRGKVPYASHETKVQFRSLAVYHIFHNTDTWRVRFVSVNGEASRVKLSIKKKFKCWKNNFEKKNLKKKFRLFFSVFLQCPRAYTRIYRAPYVKFFVRNPGRQFSKIFRAEI